MNDDPDEIIAGPDDAEILEAMRSPVIDASPGVFCFNDETLTCENGWRFVVFYDGGRRDQDYIDRVYAPDGRRWAYPFTGTIPDGYSVCGHIVAYSYRDDIVAAGEGHGDFDLSRVPK